MRTGVAALPASSVGRVGRATSIKQARVHLRDQKKWDETVTHGCYNGMRRIHSTIGVDVG